MSNPYKHTIYLRQQRWVDVEFVSRRCITGQELRLFQYTSMSYPPALSGRLYRVIYLFIRYFSEKVNNEACMQEYPDKVCPDRQRF